MVGLFVFEIPNAAGAAEDLVFVAYVVTHGCEATTCRIRSVSNGCTHYRT